MNIKELELQLGRVQEWIKAADHKNSIFLALIVGLVALSFDSIVPIITTHFAQSNTVAVMFFYLGLTTITWSIIKALFMLKPSLKSNNKSLTYFKHIAELNPEQYKKQLDRLTSENYREDLIQQIHTSSVIARNKHAQLSESVSIFLFGLIMLALFMLGVFVG